jgi:hypothetical protein
MPSLDCIVFVRRQSPDWRALMRDHEAGAMVDPSRYRPPSDVPGFPGDTVGCIEVWNRTLSVNFFRCRHILKQISDQTVSLVPNSICIDDDRLGELPELVGASRFLLFFFDDDDWFAPHTFERLEALDLDQCDIAVFPLPRLGDDIITFIRPAAGARIIVGSRVDCTFRFQTNNYGISNRLALSDHLPNLRDHMLASEYVAKLNIRDPYYDVLISVTNKTPCSASSLDRLRDDPGEYRASIRRYVENLERLPLPRELAWMASPIGETVKLLKAV